MKIKLKYSSRSVIGALILPVTTKDLKSKSFKDFLKQEGILKKNISFFKANVGEIISVTGENTSSIHLLGLGETPGYKTICDTFRKFSHNYKQRIPEKISIHLLYAKLADHLDHCTLLLEAAMNGLLLGTYNIGLYKTTEVDTHPLRSKTAVLTLSIEEKHQITVKEAIYKGEAKAMTQLSIMDLVNAPGNKAIPQVLGKWAVNSGKKFGYKVSVFSKAKIQSTGLHTLLAVNRGSEYPPAFIVMEYKPKKVGKQKLPKIGLVGKGVTFDTGGISIKGSHNMHYMKSDMGGAAAVLGAMELTAKLQLPIHLIAVIPATDNCVDARSIKPGDVINSYSGKTIEIIDTDAEGRLILADGLAYINKIYKPEIMIDLATLTGSTVRTLGYQAGAIFTNNQKLSNDLTQVGEKIGERLWPLPLWDEYTKDIESDVADVRNFSGRPIAGAISAAKFLEVFTNDHPQWAHLDIAGVAFGDSPYTKQKSATAYGVNLLVEYFQYLID